MKQVSPESPYPHPLLTHCSGAVSSLCIHPVSISYQSQPIEAASLHDGVWLNTMQYLVHTLNLYPFSQNSQEGFAVWKEQAGAGHGVMLLINFTCTELQNISTLYFQLFNNLVATVVQRIPSSLAQSADVAFLNSPQISCSCKLHLPAPWSRAFLTSQMASCMLAPPHEQELLSLVHC